MINKKVLLVYDYFDPAYKAGGPIRSLANLVKLLEHAFDLFVLTSNQDHDGSTLEVIPDQWLDYGKNAQVHYVSKRNRGYTAINKTIRELNPDVVYLNGVYSLPFVVYPLWALRGNTRIKIICASRGMLQVESLSIKPWKKKVFLAIMKMFLLHKKMHWHVTTNQEQEDVRHFLGNNKHIHLLGNVPAFDRDQKVQTKIFNKQKTFGTVALISPMKNIHLVLEAFSKITAELTYTLYGPVKDPGYWKECQEIIHDLPENIHVYYRGEIMPDNVSEVINGFDFYIQPSKSENFGHSIFEAFNTGVPVIISDQTPWKGLRDKKVGWDVDLDDTQVLVKAIEEALSMDKATYLEFSKGARAIAETYMAEHDFVKLYKDLFD